MAQLAKLTVNLIDSFGRQTSRTYQHRTADIPDADANALIAALQAITRMGVVGATISKPVSITTTDPQNEATTAQDASLRCRKSTLNDSRGGVYSFNLPHPLPALIVTGSKNLDTANSVFLDWVELFDDGAGLAGVAGSWFISDGEELVEGTASANAIIGGELDRF